MPHRAPRLPHVLLSVPVTVAMAASLAPVSRAQSMASDRPQQIVIAVDPGHGGVADNNHPDQPFDPGTIAADGTQEKDVTLDVGMRVQKLLQDDLVKVVMTRSDDRYMGIETRSQTAIDAGATAFVSIHFNAFGDTATGGTLVLYPGDAAQGFAQLMDSRVAARLSVYNEPDNGTQLKSDLWVHLPMPAVTVEGGYLSNPADAARIESPGYKDALASGIRDGIEAQVPDIARRKLQLQAWDASHAATPRATPGSAVSRAGDAVATGTAAAEAASSSPLAKPLIYGGLLAFSAWQRRRLWRLLRLLPYLVFPGMRRRKLRERRLHGQRLRRHAALERSRASRQPPVRRRPRSARKPLFDELGVGR